MPIKEVASLANYEAKLTKQGTGIGIENVYATPMANVVIAYNEAKHHVVPLDHVTDILTWLATRTKHDGNPQVELLAPNNGDKPTAVANSYGARRTFLTNSTVVIQNSSAVGNKAMAPNYLIAARSATAGVAKGIIPIVEPIVVDTDGEAVPNAGNFQEMVLSRNGYKHADLMPN